jgi:hypothetical protein
MTLSLEEIKMDYQKTAKGDYIGLGNYATKDFEGYSGTAKLDSDMAFEIPPTKKILEEAFGLIQSIIPDAQFAGGDIPYKGVNTIHVHFFVE